MSFLANISHCRRIYIPLKQFIFARGESFVWRMPSQSYLIRAPKPPFPPLPSPGPPTPLRHNPIFGPHLLWFLLGASAGCGLLKSISPIPHPN